MVKHGGTCGVHSGRENVTLTTAHRPCLEAGQAWSLFFTSSSLPRHLDPSLAFHRHDTFMRVFLRSRTAYCWEASCLQKDTSMLYFLRPFPFPGVDKVPQQGQQLHLVNKVWMICAWNSISSLKPESWALWLLFWWFWILSFHSSNQISRLALLLI